MPSPSQLGDDVTTQEAGRARHRDLRHWHSYQRRHGARPSFHICSSWVLSRSVSIGCQKPWWRKAVELAAVGEPVHRLALPRCRRRR